MADSRGALEFGEELELLARDAGLDVVGIASAEPFADTRRHLEERKASGLHGGMHFTYGDPARSTDPSRALPGARALVVGALSYRSADPYKNAEQSNDTCSGPLGAMGPMGTVARYSWRDHYQVLRDALEIVATRIVQRGWRAKVLVDDNSLVDRAAAARAGIGWYGKNAMVLVPGLGSWFVLGSVVTDAPVATAERAEGAAIPDGCGRCTRCISACPTGAIVGPGVVDARKCLAWLLEAPGPFPRELRSALGTRIYGCDECQDVCPVNRRADIKHPPPAAKPDDERVVDLVELLLQEDDELLERFGRWYIAKRQAKYLRRNALVALGNSSAADDPGVNESLSRSLAHSDPTVRAHAVWAASRLGLMHLAGDLWASESDPEVLEELALAPV